MSNHSKEFFELIRGIGEAKSKQEEDKLILKEMAILKVGMENPKVTLKMMKEYMVRLLYCEMLGHDASSGYVNAIKLTSSKEMLEKRVGYLAVTLCLPPEHELLLLLISNLQNDMKSTNYVSACCALTAAAKIVNEETVPALLPQVLDLRKHAKPIVRKKAVSTLHRFFQISPSSVPDIVDYAKEALCDRDPSVMGASLCLIYDLLISQEYTRQLKDLVPGLVNILKQIIERRLSRDFDYHRLPAPWMQINVLKCLSLLCADDRQSSELVYEVLRDGMQRADTGLNIGHAVVFEFVKTITAIYPNNLLLESAASAISRFITSSNHNLKYLGIQSLTQIVKINPKYAIQHQMVVINCLEDTDETLRRRTLELLFTMTNANNVTVIVKRLLDFAKKSIDAHMRKDLIERISILAKNFSPSIPWYLDTMNSLFEIDPQYIPQESLQNMMSVIGEGVGVEEDDAEMRSHCVETFCNVIDSKNVIHDLHMQVIAWVLGEYSYMNESYDSSDILAKLCDLVERQLEFEETRCWIISAMVKIIAQCKYASPEVVEYFKKYKDSKNVDLQQRCYEGIALVDACERCGWDDIMDAVLPPDGAYEDMEVDSKMSFAHDYVNGLLRKGARKYLSTEDQRQVLSDVVAKPAKRQLKFDKYDTPTSNIPVSTNIVESSQIDLTSARSNVSTMNNSAISTSLPKKKGGMWGSEDTVPEPVKEPTPSSSVVTPMETKHTSPYTSESSSSHSPIMKHQSSTEPKVDTKAMKKLNQFGGMFLGMDGGSGGAAGGSTGSGNRPKKQPAKTVQRKLSKGHSHKPQLLEQDDSTTTTHTSSTTSGSGSGDIFNDFETMTIHNTPSQPPAKPAVQKSSNPLDDFFDNMQPMTSTPVIHHHHHTQQQHGNKGNDLLDFGQILEPTKAVKTPPMNQRGMETLQPQNKLKKTTNLIQQLSSSYPSSFKDLTQLTRDDRLVVDYNKFWKNDSLIIALMVSTDRGFTLSQISCQFSPPSNFAMSLQTDCESRPKQNGLTFTTLDQTKPASIIVTLTPQDIVLGTRLVGQVTYSNESNAPSYFSLNIPIDTVDILTDYPDFGSTKQFAEGWKKYTQEKKNSIKVTGIFDINRCIEILKEKAKVTVIQIIDLEVIGVCRVIGRNDVVLVHSKFNPSGTAMITIRTANPTLTGNVSGLINSIF